LKREKKMRQEIKEKVRDEEGKYANEM